MQIRVNIQNVSIVIYQYESFSFLLQFCNYHILVFSKFRIQRMIPKIPIIVTCSFTIIKSRLTNSGLTILSAYLYTICNHFLSPYTWVGGIQNFALFAWGMCEHFGSLEEG